MTVEIGVNHKCINQCPERLDPTVLIPPHTYDSGYLLMIVAAPVETFTLGAVRRVFGANSGSADPECKEPFPLSYPMTSEPGSTAFFLNDAQFSPRELGYETRCKAIPRRNFGIMKLWERSSSVCWRTIIPLTLLQRFD